MVINLSGISDCPGAVKDVQGRSEAAKGRYRSRPRVAKQGPWRVKCLHFGI